MRDHARSTARIVARSDQDPLGAGLIVLNVTANERSYTSPAAREARRPAVERDETSQAERHDELHELICRHHAADGYRVVPPRLKLTCSAADWDPTVAMYRPLLCVVARGSKLLLTDGRSLTMGPGDHLVNSHDRPVTGTVQTASFSSVTLELDVGMLIEVAPDRAEAQGRLAGSADICCESATGDVLDAVLRLLRLLDTPGDLPTLWPLRERELLFRVRQGPCGASLLRIMYGFGATARIRPVITWIRENFDRPLYLDALAREHAMSSVSLRRQFRAATGMTPLQFQKALRLQQARRLLLLGGDTAASAAHAVGYASASQFTREYAGQFGEPPRRSTSLDLP